MRTKRLLIALVLIAACVGMLEAQPMRLGQYRGVWANKHSEAVITDSVMIFYMQDMADKSGHAMLYIPSLGMSTATQFTADDVVLYKAPALDIMHAGGDRITINGDTLCKVEAVETVKPYDMPVADDRNQVGARLQEWQLGTFFINSPGILMVTVGTNSHSFMYCNNNGMVYLRAATLLQCNEGSLFIQNIRMMKNPNTGEFTNSFFDDQIGFLRRLPAIDCSLFQPDRCFFGENADIYWSYISHTPDEIMINGCGETYNIGRRTKDSSLFEWIKYEPVSVELKNVKPVVSE